VYFSISNHANYSISDIKLLIIYKIYNGRVIDYSAKIMNGPILPKLALQCHHEHEVNYFRKYSKAQKWLEGSVEVRIFGYN